MTLATFDFLGQHITLDKLSGTVGLISIRFQRLCLTTRVLLLGMRLGAITLFLSAHLGTLGQIKMGHWVLYTCVAA